MNERIARLIELLGIKKVDFANAIGVSQPFVSELCSGAKSPSDRTVSDICRVFNVNEDWLRRGDESNGIFKQVPPDTQLSRIFSEIQLSEDDTIKAIIRTYWGLSDSDKAVIRRMVQGLADQIKNDQGKDPGQ